MNNGYTRIPNELIRNPHLPPIAKVVWSVIAGMKPGFVATVQQYCTMVACHPNTWRSTIKTLEKYGMISVEHSPNGVTYTAITDPSKWTVEGNKNCDPNKNCEGNKNCYAECNKNCYAEGNKNCDLSEEQIKEQENNSTTTCAHARERLLKELFADARIELAMMQHHITVEQYRQLVKDIIADWQFRDLPESDYNLNHFSSVLRYRVAAINNRNNGNNQQPGNTGNPIDKLDQDAVKAMAALAAQSQRPAGVPF